MEKATCPRCGAEVRLIDGWNLCPMCAMLVENEADSHWKEVMDLAQKHGFIVHAAGGAAMLVTHKNQKKFYGEEEYRRIQKMNGRQK